MFKILVVDDTKSIHAYVCGTLNGKQGITTNSVFNGKEAVDLVKSEGLFDLILLDWEMPVLSGIETLQQLKSKTPNTPVIMMTSKNSVEDITRAFSLGASEYIMKPFTPEILFEKINRVMGEVF
jgi:two-component system chemotaxis response regulator CheY